ncbi:hypothetical protein GCM10018793_23270 [Streptomyces sulfonofaciens]|uniref:DUF4331 domain-containing protein n=1 Tax=Streptomyces sulfonofaciens TaxID=68272 RepID=A0A919G3E2_9ACTN|nr:DUF4331 family protein [Streptomyces sulfonofaciens]GHH76771.1 hypothetical protein GCM10018793_23270 [Streptomyces sulfonofaciens]
MSHHLDSPVARQDPRLDITDLYVFRGERGTACVMNAAHSLAGEATASGFHPQGRYEFKMDTDGDAVEDITYRFSFGEPARDGTQPYELRRLTGAPAQDPFAPGSVMAEGRTGRTTGLDDGARVWAGTAGDTFWIDPDVLQAVGRAVKDGTRVDLHGWDPAGASNAFAGQSVHTMVLEISDTELLGLTGAHRHIGVWGLASLATDSGGWRQINRAGLPMIHPLFTQYDEELGDQLNGGRPADDPHVFGKIAADMIAGTVRAHGTAEDPDAYGHVAAARLFPNLLPYTVGTPASFGFAQWNGRALTDNAPDTMFSFATNTPVTTGLTREAVTARPTGTFPYVPAERP